MLNKKKNESGGKSFVTQGYSSNRREGVNIHIKENNTSKLIKNNIKLTDSDYKNINTFFSNEDFILTIVDKQIFLSFEFTLNQNSQSFVEHKATFLNLLSGLEKIFLTLKYNSQNKEKNSI